MRWFGLAIAAAVAFGGQAAAQTIKWDLTNEYQPGSLPALGDVFFAEKVKALSGGRIEVTNHFSAALGFKSQQVLDAVGQGAVPLGDASSIFWGGIHPVFQLSGLPFLTTSPAQSRQLFDIAKPVFEKVLAANNQMLLFTTPWPPSGIWTKKDITEPAHLRGLKIRTYDAPSTNTFRSIGAAPQQLAWADVVPSLSTGTIEAVLTSADGGAAAKFWEHQPMFLEANYAMPLSMATINVDVFKKLPADLQKAVLDAGVQTQDQQWGALANRVAENYKEMRSHNMKIVEKVPAAVLETLGKAGGPIIEEWVQKMGADGKMIIEEFRKKASAS